MQAHPAAHWEKFDKLPKGVRCRLCPHNCPIPEGKVGLCGVRVNIEGELKTLIYGVITAAHVDPIEKKPLYHFYPGSDIFSIGTAGCSFRCQFCQNWEISQLPWEFGLGAIQTMSKTMSPREVATLAITGTSIGVAYTYSEPMIWFEFLMGTAPLVKEMGGKNVFVTNGFINKAPLKELLNFADAFNVDLKSINEDFYKKIRGDLKPVLDNLIEIKKKAHLEITNLIIPGENDGEEEIEKLAIWIAKNLGKDTPLHISRYYPAYKYTKPPTPLTTLNKAYEIAKTHLDFVYLGNVIDIEKSSTYCPKCGSLLIKREGYFTEVVNLEGNRCKVCGAEVNVVQ